MLKEREREREREREPGLALGIGVCKEVVRTGRVHRNEVGGRVDLKEDEVEELKNLPNRGV